MKSYKLWVAVDENGDVYVYVGDKPKYCERQEEWLNNLSLLQADYALLFRDKELKGGAAAIKEIDLEFPTKGEEIVQHNEQTGIKQAAKQNSMKYMECEEAAYIIPFCHGAEWAIEKCNQIMRRVLEHYEHGGVMDCIMADYEEIVSIEME